MSNRFFLLKPCRTTPAFISTLKKSQRLDLNAARMKLETAGYAVQDVQVMLIVAATPEATLYESGKVLVKTDDAEAARVQVERLYEVLGIAG